MSKTGRYLEILRPGMLTTVQDMGRTGYQQFGMPVSGPMDCWSYGLANLLVGNLPGAACLEATIYGPEVLFHSGGWMAICGADMEPRINGDIIGNNCVYRFKSGDILSTGYANKGSRSYMAFSGGLGVPMVMGSRATYLMGKIGGVQGRALKQGDFLKLEDNTFKPFPETLSAKITDVSFVAGPIRILPGPETYSLDLEALQNLLNGTFTIGTNSNRMGYRLEGVPVKPKRESSNIVSVPVPMGTIQAPAGGEPVILMADRQTTGGYPRIAIAATIDLPRLGQLKPGDSITFEEIDLDHAKRLIVEKSQWIRKLRAALRGA